MKTEKHIAMYFNLGSSENGTVYENLSDQFNSGYHFLYTAANWSGVTFYLEANGKATQVGDTLFIQLADTAGNAVAGSELTFSNTGGRQRTGALTLVDATAYVIQAKGNDASNYLINHVRLIAVQNSAAWKGETYLPLQIGASSQTNSTSYVYPQGAIRRIYDSGQFDGTVSIHLEVCLEVSSTGTDTTAFVDLYDVTADAVVTGSELSTVNTAATRLRSGALTLTNGNTYLLRAKKVGGVFSSQVNGASLVLIQSGIVTKTMCPLIFHAPDSNVPAQNNVFADTDFITDHDVLFTPSNFNSIKRVRSYNILQSAGF